MPVKRRPGTRTYRDSAGRQQTQTDYVEHGSDQHALMLGLRKAKDGEPFVVDGWTFASLTQFGAAARDFYIQQMLEERVGELRMPMGKPQSEDRWAPNYAPAMFDPEHEHMA